MSEHGSSNLLPHLLGQPAARRGGDGFGQNLIDDARWLLRGRALRGKPIVWRRPDYDEGRAIADDPFLGHFADTVTALAWVDGLACVVLERTWHGWPDPPRFALFAMRNRQIEIAIDFADWPAAWRLDEDRRPPAGGPAPG